MCYLLEQGPAFGNMGRRQATQSMMDLFLSSVRGVVTNLRTRIAELSVAREEAEPPRPPPCYVVCGQAHDDVATHHLTGANTHQDLVHSASVCFPHAVRRVCPASGLEVPHLAQQRGRGLACLVGRVGFALARWRTGMSYGSASAVFPGAFSHDSGKVSGHATDVMMEVCKALDLYVVPQLVRLPEPHELPALTPTAFSKVLPLCLCVVDATYFETDKFSRSIRLRNMTRSWAKKNCNVKMTIVTGPDGAPLFISPLFAADGKGADNSAMHMAFEEGLGEWCVRVRAYRIARNTMKEEDQLSFLADRAYDEQSIPERYRSLVKIRVPVTPAGKKMSRPEARESREVTEFRNVVEHFNRRLQEYKLLVNHIPNKVLPRLALYVRVVAALQTLWRQPLRLRAASSPTLRAPTQRETDVRESELEALEELSTQATPFITARETPLKFFERSSEMCSHRRAGKRTPQNVEIPECFDLIECPMVLHISTSKFDARNTPDAFKHVPDLF